MGILEARSRPLPRPRCALLAPAVRARQPLRSTDLVSIRADGGNGANSRRLPRQLSTTARAVFFQTTEPLVAADTDAAIDVYERSNGATTLLSTGPTGGNGANSATFAARLAGRHAGHLPHDGAAGGRRHRQRPGPLRALRRGRRRRSRPVRSDGNGASPARVLRHLRGRNARVLPDRGAARRRPTPTPTSTSTTARAGRPPEISTGSLGGNGAFPATVRRRDAGRLARLLPHRRAARGHRRRRADQDVYQRTRRRDDAPVDRPGRRQRQRRLRLRRVLRRGLRGRLEGLAATRTRCWCPATRTRRSTCTSARAARIALRLDRAGRRQRCLRRVLRRAPPRTARGSSSTRRSRWRPATPMPHTTSTSASGGATTLMSTGPGGGNGTFFSSLLRHREDGSRLFFATSSRWCAADTDAAQDVYERSGGSDDARFNGPDGGNGENTASFLGASRDGARVFFSTDESLVGDRHRPVPRHLRARRRPDDAASRPGRSAAPATSSPSSAGLAADGSRVFFETSEPLPRIDTDAAQDVYQASVAFSGYPRPKSAAQLCCLAGARLPSRARRRTASTARRCHTARAIPPTQTSSQLTVGSPGRERPGRQLGRLGAAPA